MSPEIKAPLGGCASILAAAAIGTSLIAINWPVPSPEGLAIIFCFAVLIAGGHFAALGAPAYLVVTQRWPLRWWNAGLVGSAVGMLPITFVMATQLAAERPDWPGRLNAILLCGIAGAAAGLTLRAFRGTDPRDLPAEEEE